MSGIDNLKDKDLDLIRSHLQTESFLFVALHKFFADWGPQTNDSLVGGIREKIGEMEDQASDILIVLDEDSMEPDCQPIDRINARCPALLPGQVGPVSTPEPDGQGEEIAAKVDGVGKEFGYE